MRKRLLVAVLVSAIAAFIAAILTIPSNGLTCEEWQEQYRTVARQGEGGAFAFISQGPTAAKFRELEEQRPEGGETPER